MFWHSIGFYSMFLTNRKSNSKIKESISISILTIEVIKSIARSIITFGIKISNSLANFFNFYSALSFLQFSLTSVEKRQVPKTAMSQCVPVSPTIDIYYYL